MRGRYACQESIHSDVSPRGRVIEMLMVLTLSKFDLQG